MKNRPFTALIITAVALTALLSGCADVSPTEGTVASKSYTPEHTEVRVIGKALLPTKVPAKWEICFTSTTQTRCVNVRKSVYNTIQRGDIFQVTS